MNHCLRTKNTGMQESTQQIRGTTSYPHKIFSVQDALNRSNDVSALIRCCLTKHEKSPREVKAGRRVGVRFTFGFKIITGVVIKGTLYHNPAGKSLPDLLWTVGLISNRKALEELECTCSDPLGCSSPQPNTTSPLPLFLTCAKRGSSTPALQTRSTGSAEQIYHWGMLLLCWILIFNSNWQWSFQSCLPWPCWPAPHF